nr:zinc finger protein 585A-like isoform X2 [Leptinotarsa decemlineata]
MDVDEGCERARKIALAKAESFQAHNSLVRRLANITLETNEIFSNNNTSLTPNILAKPSDGAEEKVIDKELSSRLDKLVLNENVKQGSFRGVSKKSITRREHKYKMCSNRFKRITSKAKQTIFFPADQHICSTCQAVFTTIPDLSEHRKAHLEKQVYQCEFCCKFFVHRSSLVAHKFLHEREVPYICRVCQQTFSCGSDLTKHSVIHRSTNKHRCEICSKYYLNKYYFMIHSGNSMDDEPFYCKFCYKSLALCLSLIAHESTHMTFTPYTCPICLGLFANHSLYQRHAKIHEGDHYAIHMGEEPYQCQLCSKYFPDGMRLIAHKVGTNGVCKV